MEAISTQAFRRLTNVKGHLIRSSACSAQAQAPNDVMRRHRRDVDVLDTRMSYVDTGGGAGRTGEGATVLFIHGNPTAAFLWRNVIPHVQPRARCIAPDLVGFGRSGKVPNGDYRFVNMYRYFCAWLDGVAPCGKLVLVLHDWGSCFGFHWAFQHRDRVQAIVHMESMVGVLRDYDSFPPEFRPMYEAMRSASGERVFLRGDALPRLAQATFGDKLSAEQLREYTRAYENPGDDRKPFLTLSRDIPTRTDGPWEMVHLVDNYSKWLSRSTDLPKLLVEAKPGAYSKFLKIATRKWVNQKCVVVKGDHFLQEDSPADIGREIVTFLSEIGA